MFQWIQLNIYNLTICDWNSSSPISKLKKKIWPHVTQLRRKYKSQTPYENMMQPEVPTEPEEERTVTNTSYQKKKKN